MFQYFEILSKSDHLEMEQNLLHSIIKIPLKLKYLMKEKNPDRVKYAREPLPREHGRGLMSLSLVSLIVKKLTRYMK